MDKKNKGRPLIRKSYDLLKKSNVKIKRINTDIERTFFPVDSKIGKYKIIEEIDRGGMAVVYKALQLDLDRVVALKILPANITINQRFVERFLSEAHAVASLNHPNIVSIHEVSMENNVYFLAMDYVPGDNLYYYLNDKKPKVVEVLQICTKLADALAYAHRQKIMHRDLKLNNVIMKDNKFPILIDFGLAKAIESDDKGITKTGELMGSPSYMAPERIIGARHDSRSDICSLGIMLYEMLTFKNPYLDPRSIHQTTANVVEAEPISPGKLVPWLPPEIEAITLKAMEGDVEQRYQTMEEFRDDMERYQKGEEVSVSLPSFRSKVVSYVRKKWPVFAMSSIVLFFVIVMLSILYVQKKKTLWHWQLVVDGLKEDTAFFTDASVFRSGTNGRKTISIQEDGGWKLSNGALIINENNKSFLRFNSLFTRDLKVEFTISSLSSDFYHTGFFFYGDSPNDAYCFHFFHKGTEKSGITYPGSVFLFSNNIDVKEDNEYDVTIEKNGEIISFFMNEKNIARIYDYFPSYGEGHQKIGFFTYGGKYKVDNFKIYRRTVPFHAKPTLIADRFLKYGDYDAAISEYKDLLVDFSQRSLVREVQLKIAGSYIRSGQYEKADKLIERLQQKREGMDDYNSRWLFLKGKLFEQMGQKEDTERCYLTLADLYPDAEVTKAVLAEEILYCEELLNKGLPDSAEGLILKFSSKYPEYSPLIGKFHYEIAQYFEQHGEIEKAMEVSKRIISLHFNDNDLVNKSRIIIARYHLVNYENMKAVDILNQSIVSQPQGEGIWEVWIQLGEIYEMIGEYRNALKVFKKVYNDCPESFQIRWTARRKMGEVASEVSFQEKPVTVFNQIINDNHPFKTERLIASFYCDKVSFWDFSEEFSRITDSEYSYLPFCARKAGMNGAFDEELIYLQSFLEQCNTSSWIYLKNYQKLQKVKKNLN